MYAINLDGGSSSAMVHQSTILNRPTCIHNILVGPRGLKCERAVASVICLHGSVLHHIDGVVRNDSEERKDIGTNTTVSERYST
jgi:Phosphodiester glycosidase